MKLFNKCICGHRPKVKTKGGEVVVHCGFLGCNNREAVQDYDKFDASISWNALISHLTTLEILRKATQ